MKDWYLIKNIKQLLVEKYFSNKYKVKIPPPHLRRGGKNYLNFFKEGEKQLELLKRFTPITPKSNILDVGCGDGKLATVLTRYLSSGSYDAFDINKDRIDYLKNNIQSRFPHFNFLYSDIYHSYYNPKGKQKAEQFKFPYKSGEFDIVFLNSIFTHLVPYTIQNYLSEINRVLKIKGILVASFFIANHEAHMLDRLGLSSENLKLGKKSLMNFKAHNYWYRDKKVHERIVLIDEFWLKKAFLNKGLSISQVHYGWWCGRNTLRQNEQQDFIIASKLNLK